jgi:hypothetical protein
MDLQQKLDSIQASREKLLQQTPSEHNADKVNEYYQEVLQAKKVNEDAPNQLKDAEENYYKARFGDQYTDVKRQKYVSESKEVMQSMLKAHQEQLKDLDDRLQTYSSSRSYYKNMEEVQKTWLDKIKKWVRQIQDSQASMNNRNAFYAEQEHSNLSGWILFENAFLLSFIVVTIVTTAMTYKESEESRHEVMIKSIGIGALLCIVFFTNTFLSWLRYLPKSVTFYTQWGYDPMESKLPWVLIMVFVLFGTICVVYVDVITAFLDQMKDNWQRYRRPRAPTGPVRGPAARALASRVSGPARPAMPSPGELIRQRGSLVRRSRV